MLSNNEFEKLAKLTVRDYVNQHLDKSDPATDYDIYIVWMCRILQNNKALLSTSLLDGMYYEITYNGEKNEIYLDAYKKFQNICIPRE